MLEKQDLEMIRLVVREEVQVSIAESEARMSAKIESSIAESEARMKIHIHDEIGYSENRVLSELDRVEMKLTARMDRIEKTMNEICEYYRIRRLDDTNALYILRLFDSLSRRIEVLEAKIA